MRCKAAAVFARGPGPVWVASNAALAEAVGHCRGAVGLDTEFQRVDTFFPIAGLYQLASAAGLWLIDPLAIDDWSPFKELLEDGECVKVMHACSEDLALIAHHLGAQPRNLFDTQLAHAFLSEHFSLSYGALVEAVLGHALAKRQTRSNWLRRPLSAAQRHYAQEDVAHLLDLRRHLQERLQARGRLSWFWEETSRWTQLTVSGPDDYFVGLKGAWRLAPVELGALRDLCAWRERKAMAENRPRQWLVGDEQLLAFARQTALTQARIEAGMPRRSARRYARELLQAHRRGRKRPEARALPAPLGRSQAAALKQLRELGRRRAEDLGLAPELLCRKRDLEVCLRHYAAQGELPAAYSGWRKAVVGADFAEVLARAQS